MKVCKLGKEERRKVYRMRRLGYSVRGIGRELGRHHTTILRELKRNRDTYASDADYYTQAEQAHEATKCRRSMASRRMRLKSVEIRHYVELHLREAEWSPEIIGGKLGTIGQSISAEAIYQWINVERPELKRCLLIAGKSRRRRRTGKGHRSPVAAASKRSIEEHPEDAKERTRIGHFEMDALCGRKGTSVIQNKVDRKSRKMWLDLCPTLESKPYADICIERLKDIPEGVLQTLLMDNGTEHADHTRIDDLLNLASYFCHPYCSSERGTVENRNKALRRFLPKGEIFDDLPREFLDWVEDYFNNMPMKILGFKTPNQVWEENLKLAA